MVYITIRYIIVSDKNTKKYAISFNFKKHTNDLIKPNNVCK